MNFLDKLLFCISVPKCVSCNERLELQDLGLCRICAKDYFEHKLRNCSHCSKILSECTCVNDYLKSHSVRRLVKVCRYVNREDSERRFPSNMLIYSLKRDNRADVLSFLSEELAAAIKNSIKYDKTSFIITSVPRRRAAINRYGIDHAKLLAKAVAKKLDLPYAEFLKSTARSAQKKMREQERIKNATFDYRKSDISIEGKRVILIDDIVTTGASMGSCALLLRAIGAKEIIGAAISIAYKDKTVDLSPERKYR